MGGRSESLRRLAWPWGLAAGVFALGVGAMRLLERGAAEGVRGQLTAQGEPRPVADVARQVAALKLVTVELDTRVVRTAVDRSWRGDVEARVEAPVTLLFGVDLSEMTAARVAVSPLTGAWVVRVPGVRRIATEVRLDRETSDVSLGWLRFRSISGERVLGEARKGLYPRAQELALPPEERDRVVEITRRQVAALVWRIVGEGARVAVVFDDEPVWEWAAAAAGGATR